MTTTTDLRLALQANGYQPLPAHGKKVFLEEWSTKTDVPQSEVAAWGVEHPQWSNTSTLTSRTPTIDDDIRDPDAAEAVEEMVRDWLDERGIILVRFGEPPKRAILCRTDRPFPKISASFVAPNGDAHKIEILGDGQQVVVAGIHPDTKKPYTWHGGEPWTVPRSELPEINEAEAQDFIARAARMLEEKFDFKRVETRGNGHAADASKFIVHKAAVDVTHELASIHHGNIHDTWLSCMGSLLRRGTPANDAVRRLKQAAEQSSACQADPNRKLWGKALAEMLTWYVRNDPTLVPNLPPKQQRDWYARLKEGRTPRLIWRDDHGLQVRREKSDTANETDAAPAAAPEVPKATGEPAEKEQPVAALKKYKFPLLRFGEMRPGTEPNYLVDELIPVAGLVVVYGAPKGGKSFWVLDLMLHVALGWEYRERAVQQGTIVYCAFEGAHGYRKRCEAFRRHHLLTDEDPPLYVVPGRADLIRDHAALIADMKAQLAELAASVRCVVLDTLNKSLIGSESKDVDMANYIAAAEAIQAAFGCVVVIVHHHGIDDTRPRGHTSLRGAVDAQIKVTRDDQNTIIAEIEEMRDGPEGAQIMSCLVVVGVGDDNAGRPLTSAVVEPVDPSTRTDGHKLPELTRNQRTMFSIVDAAPAGLSTDEWNDQAREAGIGVKRRADLHDLRNSLKARGLVCENSGRWFVVPKFKSRSD